MLSRRRKIEAGELALAMSWGYAQLQEVTNWADSIIATSETPDDILIELSLSESASTSISYLNELSDPTEYWLITSCFLGRSYQLANMPPQEASKLARKLYDLAMRDDAPSYFQNFASHWDNIDLAVDGVMGNIDESIQNFLKDIREAVEKGGGHA